MIILLSSTRAHIACHSSFEKLEYPNLESTFSKISISNSLKKTSRLGCPVVDFHDNLVEDDGFSLKLGVGCYTFQNTSFYKILTHFKIHPPTKFFKATTKLQLINFAQNGGIVRPFSRTLNSTSVKNFLLRLDTASEQNQPFNRLVSVPFL